jgi:hypothetical protein
MDIYATIKDFNENKKYDVFPPNIEIDNTNNNSHLGTVDIYGNISDKSELMIGIGNYNNIHGLLTYYPSNDCLEMKPLHEILTPSIVELVLTYETPSNINNKNRVYFSLGVKESRVLSSSQLHCTATQYNDPEYNNDHHTETLISQQKYNKYINVKVELDGDKTVACACISSEKGFFWIDYSSIDKIPRSQLMAGGLYALKTTFGEQEYVVSWKIQGFSNGDLVIFLPTTWYERENICEMKNGTITLMESLQQLRFKGYTSQQWCEEVPFVTHCTDSEQCGHCLGQCQDPNNICYVNGNPSESETTKFICGFPGNEPKFIQSNMISFADNPPQTTGTSATWVAIILILVIVIMLTWGIFR